VQQQQQQHGGNINIVSSSRFSQSVINENNNAGYNYVLWLIQKLQTTNRQQQLSQKFAKAFDAKKTTRKPTQTAAQQPHQHWQHFYELQTTLYNEFLLLHKVSPGLLLHFI